MAAPGGTVVRAGRAGRALGRFAENRRAIPVLFGVALAVYAAVSIALPLRAGRDLPRYLLVYGQLFDAHVVFPNALLARTPGTPVVTGLLLEGGPVVSEAGLAVLYALSVVAWFCVARRFGPVASLTTVAALLAYPGYLLLFHELASDALFAATFALVALLLMRAVEHPTMRAPRASGWASWRSSSRAPSARCCCCSGLRRSSPRVAGALAWRPSPPSPSRRSSRWSRSPASTRRARTTSPSSVAGRRRFSSARSSRTASSSPTTARPPASWRARCRASSSRTSPYRSRGIDLETFFSSGSSRMHDDLTVLSDRTWGWDDDYRHLGRVAREAIRAHPGTYARGVAKDLWRLLLWPLYGPVETTASSRSGSGSQPAAPVPAAATDDEPIPSSREAPYISTPDGRIREVWTSPAEHSIVFRYPADAARSAALDREVNALLAGLPDRVGHPSLAARLNDFSRLYPRPFMWLLVGIVAALWRRPRGIAVPMALAAAALAVMVSTALAVYAVAEYSVPVVPAFVLLATAGLFGRRSA